MDPATCAAAPAGPAWDYCPPGPPGEGGEGSGGAVVLAGYPLAVAAALAGVDSEPGVFDPGFDTDSGPGFEPGAGPYCR